MDDRDTDAEVNEVPAGDVPPPSPRPAAEGEPDPIAELRRLGEELARQQNRRLLYEYLRARRSLR